MTKNDVTGEVASTNENGDLVTDIQVDTIRDVANVAEVRVIVGPHETIGIHPSEHGEPESTLIAVENSDGMVEVGITGLNISEMLGIKVGEKVTIKW